MYVIALKSTSRWRATTSCWSAKAKSAVSHELGLDNPYFASKKSVTYSIFKRVGFAWYLG